jgi:hypothetical protein
VKPDSSAMCGFMILLPSTIAGFSFIKALISFRFRFLNSVWSVIMAMQSAFLIASFKAIVFLPPKLSLQYRS